MMSLLSISPLAEAPAPPNEPTMYGLGVLALLLVVGALKCAQIMRRPTASVPCVAALLVMILALAIGFVGGAVIQELQPGLGWRVLAAASCFALFVTALVLAIVGLLDYRKHADRLTQGRAQAWSAAVTSTVALLLMGAVFWSGLKDIDLASAAPADDAAVAAGQGDQKTPVADKELRTRALEAQRLADSGDKPAARKAYEQLFRDGYLDQDDLWTLIGMQLEDEDVAGALSTVDAYLARRPSAEVERWKGQLLTEHGDHDAALALFESLRERRPNDPQTAYDLAEAQEGAEKFSEALALCDQYGKSAAAEDADSWHVLRGRCQMGLKSYREARQSFQAALAANPQNDDARELAAIASGLLGQGSMAGASVSIEPVPIPAELQAEIDALPELGEEGAEYGLAERFRVTGYSYRAGKEWRATSYRSYKVFGPDGVDVLNSLTIPFDPLSERVFVNKLAVFGADGKLLAEGDVDDYYVSGDKDSDLATSDQALNVPVPQLKPGCSLVLTYTREMIAPPDEFGFESVTLGSSDPVQLAATFVVGDTDAIATVSPRVDVREGAAGLRYWSVPHPPVYAWEPDQACFDDFMPLVSLGDKGRSWESVGREHFDEIKDKLTVDPDVAARAKEVIAGAVSVDEKVARVAAFVQRELTYQGLEFGIRGQIPNRASKTLKAGYGDCKDHAVLLQQMLSAVDVPAKLALILSEGRVVEQLPTVDQFDHMMVFLPDAAPDRAFVDCTDKAGNPTAAVFDCEGRRSLVLDAEQPRLIDTPRYPDDGSHLQCKREVEIVYDAARPDAAGAVVTELVTFDPLLAPTLREMLNSYPLQERKTALADMLREYARVTILEMTVDGLAAPREPLTITLKYRVDRALHRGSGATFTGMLPSPWEQWWADVESVERRTSPFELRASQLESTVTVKLPAGFKLSTAESTANSPAGDTFLSWELTTGAADDERRLDAHQHAGEFPAEQFAAYYDQSQRLLDQIKRPIAVELAEEK